MLTSLFHLSDPPNDVIRVYTNLLESMSLLNGKIRILTVHAKEVNIKIFQEIATLS